VTVTQCHARTQLPVQGAEQPSASSCRFGMGAALAVAGRGPRRGRCAFRGDDCDLREQQRAAPQVSAQTLVSVPRRMKAANLAFASSFLTHSSRFVFSARKCFIEQRRLSQPQTGKRACRLVRMSVVPSAEGSRIVSMPKIDDRVVEGMRLHEFLALEEDKELAKAIEALFMACKVVGYEVRTASCNKEECVNAFGDQQLAVDLLADRTIEAALRASRVVAIGSSEEQPIEKDLGGSTFAVAWDPLDGSSIVDTNFSVGTIFGVWRGKRLTGITGRELEAAGMAVYGPRTSISVSVRGIPGTHEFLLVDNFSGNHGMWVLVQSFYTINEGKLFAPGNLKATQDNPGYAKLVQYWMENKYQLRYTGGMVPDCNQILIKGKGVFANPASPSAPAKLRVLYEVAPVAFLIERAGGASSDGERSALDIPIPGTDVRSQVCYGSKGEVARFNEFVGKRYMK